MPNPATSEVRKLAETYINATYEGDVDGLKEIFAETAVMNGYLNGELVIGGPEPFFAQLAANPSLKSAGAPYKANIDYIDAQGSTGSVTITETGFGPMNFTNYLHMINDGNGWKIYSKMFLGTPAD